MTIEQYNELKQKVINLRQSAIAEQGSESHAKIWEELRKLIGISKDIGGNIC